MLIYLVNNPSPSGQMLSISCWFLIYRNSFKVPLVFVVPGIVIFYQLKFKANDAGFFCKKNYQKCWIFARKLGKNSIPPFSS